MTKITFHNDHNWPKKGYLEYPTKPTMPKRTGFIGQLAKIFPVVETAALACIIAGSAFKIMHYTGANMLLLIGCSALATTWYLMAFVPASTAEDETDAPKAPGDFFSLLISTILPKIMGIAGAVTVIGILFRLLHMPGAGQMLLVGSSACGAAMAIYLFALLTGKIETLPPMVWRIGVAAAIGFYYFSLNPII